MRTYTADEFIAAMKTGEWKRHVPPLEKLCFDLETQKHVLAPAFALSMLMAGTRVLIEINGIEIAATFLGELLADIRKSFPERAALAEREDEEALH